MVAARMFAQDYEQIVYMVAITDSMEYVVRPQLQDHMHLVPIGLYRWAAYCVAARMFVQYRTQIVYLVATIHDSMEYFTRSSCRTTCT
eukprot:2991347-Alexandrium_andersonii.AAC.1